MGGGGGRGNYLNRTLTADTSTFLKIAKFVCYLLLRTCVYRYCRIETDVSVSGRVWYSCLLSKIIFETFST